MRGSQRCPLPPLLCCAETGLNQCDNKLERLHSEPAPNGGAKAELDASEKLSVNCHSGCEDLS